MKARGLAVAVLVACGKVADTPDGSLVDASSDVATADASSDVSIPDWNDCDGGLNVGYPCTSNGDCCSQHCFEGSCQRPACTSDGVACQGDVECCSGNCLGGACASLFCRVAGNACTRDADCCSQTCRGAVCVQPSFCGQSNEACVKDSDCCLGLCQRSQPSLLGTCGILPESMCGLIGLSCSIALDGGPPACGGGCCSRNCVPWGPFRVPICLPPSGCHPVGEVCHHDSDCCGGVNQVCIMQNPDAGIGVCSNPTGCKPNGDICRDSTQCNATDMCCSGVVSAADTCQIDENGTPRCSVPRDGGTCLDAGSACATSSDCCNRAPCVPNGDAAGCYNDNCVPNGSACTTDADCCVGTQCYLTGAATTGTCRALGTTCALVGQLCSTPSDCCNAVPCTNGRCTW